MSKKEQIGRYEVKRYLNKGGMAEVYLARDVALKRDVCLKVMLASLTQYPDLLTRFKREARTIARLQHPQIVQIYDIGLTPQERPYLAMEYIAGGSLHDFIARQNQGLSAVRVLELMREVALALATVHQAEVVHRDLKPANILLRADGTPVLADMGIVAVQEATRRLTRTGRMPGTPHYMSPEQIKGERELDGRSDIYALGIILYELLAGQCPFEDDDPMLILHRQLYQRPAPLARLRPGLSPTTYRLVNTCLKKNPVHRYQNTSELVAALDQAIVAEKSGRWRSMPLTVLAGLLAREHWWAYLLLPLFLIALLFLGGRAFSSPGFEPPVTRIPTATPALVAGLPSATLPAVAILSPTNTPLATESPPATITISPTDTPEPTLTPEPTFTPMPPLTSIAPPLVLLPTATTVSCVAAAESRWHSTLYNQYKDRLGCPLSGEIRPEGAYQLFQKGLMVWRGDRDLVYIFYYDDGSYAVYDVHDASVTYANQNDLMKGAFGWLWNSDEPIRTRLGTPTMAEANTSDFVIQDFSGGVIFYFLENNANHYVLLKDQNRWLTVRE